MFFFSNRLGSTECNVRWIDESWHEKSTVLGVEQLYKALVEMYAKKKLLLNPVVFSTV